MAQIFRPSANTLAKASILFIIILGGFLFWAQRETHRAAYLTRKEVIRAQPIMFTHKHHVSDIGIDCRYCHTSVDQAAVAGVPPTATCMNCHNQIWAQSDFLAPVRESAKTAKPIAWNRVHDVPDFVYFNHSIHVAKGVGCQTCHGEVDRMPMVFQKNTLNMEWCLECHREPEKFLRPKEEVFNMEYRQPANQSTVGKQLVHDYHVQNLTNCTTCHR